MKVLPLALLAGGGYLIARNFFNTGQAIQRLQYSNPKIKIGKLSLTQLPLDLTLDIRNPGSTDISLDYFTGDVYYQGRRLSSFTFNQSGKNFVIKARTITTVPFTVILSNISTISTIINILQGLASGGGISTVITVTGSLYAAGFDVPVNFAYDIKNNVLLKNNPAVYGIGSVKATLEFGNNAEMAKYFSKQREAKKIMFSKN